MDIPVPIPCRAMSLFVLFSFLWNPYLFPYSLKIFPNFTGVPQRPLAGCAGYFFAKNKRPALGQTEEKCYNIDRKGATPSQCGSQQESLTK
jgi:hypothetical protein